MYPRTVGDLQMIWAIVALIPIGLLMAVGGVILLYLIAAHFRFPAEY
jgi:hypothetical protein